MLSSQEVMQLIGSLIWLLAGVGVFIVGMNFMGDALEKSAGAGMKRMLEKISNNRFSGVVIGAGVTAIKFICNISNGYRSCKRRSNDSYAGNTYNYGC